MDNKARARSMLAMRPSDEVAQELAQEVDPRDYQYWSEHKVQELAQEVDPRDYQYWSEHKVQALARAIFNARQEGYDAGFDDALAWVEGFAQELWSRADRLDANRAAIGKAFALREVAAELRVRAKEGR